MFVIMFYLFYFPIPVHTTIAFPSIDINSLSPHRTPQSHRHKLTVQSYQSKMVCRNSYVSWSHVAW